MLRAFAHQVVRRRNEILLIAVLLAAIGVYGMMNQQTNYDLLSYLPRELSSVKGIRILNDKFGMGNTVQLLVEGMEDTEVERLKTRIARVDGVEKVSWVSDFADVTVPREFQQEELLRNYYARDATLLQVSFTEASTSPRTEKAFDEMQTLLAGKKAYLVGFLAQSRDLEVVMNQDTVKYGLSALVLVSLVLVLTIPSIIIPLLFVATIALAVIYNLGLSFYLGQELSYLTSSIVLPLQFAVTMDYALFLYHRFEEERERLPDDEAMEEAIVTTFKSISAACLTTVAGFLALMAMRLGFGADMGTVLARGVLITLLAVITVLPGLLLLFDPLIKKIAHRSFLPTFVRTAGVVTHRAPVFAVLFLLLFVPALYGYLNMTQSFDLYEGMPKDLPSIKANDLLAKKFGKQETAFLLFEDGRPLSEIEQAVSRVERVKGVKGAFGYTKLVDPLIPREFIPEEARQAFFKDGYTYYSVDIAYPAEDRRMPETLESVRRAAERYSGNSYLTGSAALVQDLKEVSVEDIDTVNYLSLAAIFIIVLLVFRSLLVPVLLVGSIELAILLNQGISTFTGSEVVFVAALAIGAIQLGATVDYAILLTARYEEELRRLGDRFAALRKAVQESAQPILVSAGTMFAATIGIALLSNIGMIRGLTALMARGAVISFLVVVLLLPALLVLSQPVLERVGLGWPKEEKRQR